MVADEIAGLATTRGVLTGQSRPGCHEAGATRTHAGGRARSRPATTRKRAAQPVVCKRPALLTSATARRPSCVGLRAGTIGSRTGAPTGDRAMSLQDAMLDLNEDLLVADRIRARAWRVFVFQMIWTVLLRALSRRWARQVVAETRRGPQ